ncbi:hypothetical protein [Nocardiopsis kunsanensis]|uniref:hypothetical protein n=1 Tax=Nocardiopsis kunsanensis TaxID=141693 RepID=UPI000347E9BD|nr:hypothetical protein [Nocardiopsis kunsanensis]
MWAFGELLDDLLPRRRSRSAPREVTRRSFRFPTRDRTTPASPGRGANAPEVYRWAWSVYLGDGMRALAAQGRWQDAAEQARLLGGVGQRLFDGRQVTVLARLAGGEAAPALRLVEESEVHEPWERCVQLILRLRCDQEAEGADELVENIRTLETPLFATRAGLTAFALLIRDRRLTERLLLWLIETASKDGYAASDLLDGTGADLLGTQRKSLAGSCAKAGLGPNTLPEQLLSQVRRALQDLSQQ